MPQPPARLCPDFKVSPVLRRSLCLSLSPVAPSDLAECDDDALHLQVTDGISKLSVLTWQVLERYRSKGMGCTGGLALLGDTYPKSPVRDRVRVSVRDASLPAHDDLTVFVVNMRTATNPL